MADQSVVPRILQFIQRQKNQTCKTVDILQAVRGHKKDLNIHLYKLERQGVLKKVNMSPPVWQMQGDAPNQDFPVPGGSGAMNRKRQHPPSPRGSPRGRGRGRGRGSGRGRGKAQRDKNGYSSPLRKTFKSNKGVDCESINSVLTFLQVQGRPVKTMDIARSLGFLTSMEVNPILYYMSDNGQIMVVSSQPTLWGLPRAPQHEDTLPQPGSVNMLHQYDQGGDNQSEMFTDIGDIQLSLDQEEPVFQPHELLLTPSSDQDMNAGCSYAESIHSLYSSHESTNHCSPFDDPESCIGKDSRIPTDLDVKMEPDTSDHDISFDSNVNVKCEDVDFDRTGEGVDETRRLDIMVTPVDIPLESSSSTSVNLGPKTVFTDVDILLQALLKCPMSMAKSFVLMNIMKLPSEEVMEIIQDAKKLKYVSDQNNVIVLDCKGEQYIRDKLVASGDEEQVQIGSTKPNLTPLQPRVQAKGKPLSPFELLGRQSIPLVTNMNPRLVGPASLGMRPLLGNNIHAPGMAPRLPGSFPVRCVHTNPVASQSGPPQSSSIPPLLGIQTNSVLSRLMKLSQSDSSQLQSSSSLSSLSHNSSESSPQQPSYRPPVQTMLPGSYRPPNPPSALGAGSMPFRRPQAPLDIVREQLKQTDISASNERPATTNTNASLGMQRLLNTGSQSASPSPLFPRGAGNSTQLFSGFGSQQPQSLPVMGRSALSNLPTTSGPTSLSLDFSTESFAAVNKNPVSALMEFAQCRHKVARIEVIRQTGPSHRPKFLMGVFIGSEQLATVTCANKKDGRKEVADMALRALIADGKYKTDKLSTKNVIPASQMTHFDRVAALTHQQFNSLVATIADNFAGRKVIAGLVMKTSDADLGTVISIGTGNRCITGQQMSLEGNTVNDSHAEIITRRGFIRFLYKKLLTFEPNSPNGFFVKSASGKLKIRDGITFHLYISTAPCGDGALFSPRDTASNNTPLALDRTHHPTFTSQVQGLVRTKMEGGEGTIPVESDFTVQTFDGIQRGERLRTMSCTDKICRWNVVGMQGALLSHFLEPIYLDSLTLGFLFDPGHLARAVCCRVNRGDTDINTMLPTGYQMNHPWLGRVTAVEPSRETQKTKALSVNWCYGDEMPEVTDGTQGLCYTSIEKAFFSRCTKKNLFDSFKRVCQKFGREDLLQCKNYNQTKMAAKDFQEAKNAMLKKLKENGYGTWVSKPVEEEMFS